MSQGGGRGEGEAGDPRPPPPPWGRAKDKRALRGARPAYPAAQLVLRGALAERGRGGLAPGEVAVPQGIGERPLGHVGAAPRGRRDEAARELTARDVVRTRDHARGADGVLR